MSVRYRLWTAVPIVIVIIGLVIEFGGVGGQLKESQSGWRPVNEQVEKLLQDAEERVEEPNVQKAADVVTGRSDESPKEAEQSRPAEPPLNINDANVAALDGLPGIGPSKAEAIIAYRTAHGPFETIEDIMKVKGIGEAVFAKLKGKISTNGSEANGK